MSGEILVWVEHDGSRPRKVALETLGRARSLGSAVAVVLGDGAEAVSALVAPFADLVLTSKTPGLARYSAETHGPALAELVRSRGARALLAGATFAGRELLPRIAARLGAPYLAECVDLAERSGGLAGRRALYGGKAYGWFGPSSPELQLVATVRPNSFVAPGPAPEAGPIEAVELQPVRAVTRLLAEDRAEVARPELSEAEVVVAGGRGLGSPDGFRLVEALADALGGAVGASRAVVDSGFRPHDDQVGKSGKTVSPRLYVALGISGAVHHVMGMDTSGVIVAVNKDPAAPIFKHADYGIVGDAAEVARALVERLGGTGE